MLPFAWYSVTFVYVGRCVLHSRLTQTSPHRQHRTQGRKQALQTQGPASQVGEMAADTQVFLSRDLARVG